MKQKMLCGVLAISILCILFGCKAKQDMNIQEPSTPGLNENETISKSESISSQEERKVDVFSVDIEERDFGDDRDNVIDSTESGNTQTEAVDIDLEETEKSDFKEAEHENPNSPKLEDDDTSATETSPSSSQENVESIHNNVFGEDELAERD